MIATAVSGTHLVWHLLDKLSLDLRVQVEVHAPFGMTGVAHMPSLWMSLLPGRDIVSDSVRNTGEFHCPGLFRQLVATAASAQPAESTLRVVEVGGFLGDCLLWAGAYLGPDRLQALEVEPVAAATSRLRQSLAEAGFASAVSVTTEAVGDGEEYGAFAVGASGHVPANPNFEVKRGVSAEAAAAQHGRLRRRLRSLDEILEEWLEPGAVLDLVRVKAAGSEPAILRGLQRHLAAVQVRQLMVTSNSNGIAEIRDLMARQAI
ncbi:unnamed protein product, partial [Polarella glacialis]